MTNTRLAQLEIEQHADFTRQRDFFNPTESDGRVTVVGCGGIGSATAVLLSKLGVPSLTLIDGDTIETHNIPNQFFPRTMAGKAKVDVCSAMCRLFGYSEVETHTCMIEDYPRDLSGIVVTGLDSMKARKEVWEKVKQSVVSMQYLIDARIGGQEIVVWTVNPKVQEEVETYETLGLFDDAAGEEAPCTARAVIDVMGFVASIITMQVRQILATSDEHKRPPKRLVSVSLPDLAVTDWYKEEDEKVDGVTELITEEGLEESR